MSDNRANGAGIASRTQEAASWHLVQVKRNCLDRARINLERQSVLTFMPRQQETDIRRGRLRPAMRPLFPGYLFIVLQPQSASWRAIGSSFGVARVVAFGANGPAAVPIGLISELAARCDPEGHLRNGLEVRAGEQVRVVHGPFRDVIAEITALPEPGRLRLLFELLGRTVRAEIDSRDVIPFS